MLPNWFVRTIPSAHAAIGNAKASNARTTTRLILSPSQFLLFPGFTLKICSSRYRSPTSVTALALPKYLTHIDSLLSATSDHFPSMLHECECNLLHTSNISFP